MNYEIKTSRVPNPIYLGQNGFLQGLTEPSAINETNIEQALQRHTTAQFFFEHQGRPVPSFEEMQAEINQDELDLMDSRIATLKSEHLRDLERLYALSTAKYREEVKEQYLSRDHTAGAQNSEQERAAWQMELMSLYDFSKASVQTEWQNIYEQIRHTYLEELKSLEDTKKKLQRARESMFPRSKEDFMTKNKAIQLRVAKFLLLADKDPQRLVERQEKVMAEYGWAWRQVKPLMDEFQNNPNFNADVRSLVIEQNVTDPRKPRTQSHFNSHPQS